MDSVPLSHHISGLSNIRSTMCSRTLFLLTVLLAFPGVSVALVQNCPESKSVTLPLKTRSVSVQEIGNAVLFQAGMEVDVDGAPNAYGPRNIGLDYTANAKNGEAWVGVVTDSSGNPVAQKGGSYDGYYVSTTSLRAAGGDPSDPGTYVDATQIPYIALPPSIVKQFGIVLGDLAVVMNDANGKSAYAIYADVGPRGKIGEGSIFLARALGFAQANPRHGGVASGIRFLVFPKSGLGQGKLRTLDDINNSASQVYAHWGGAEQLSACSFLSAKPNGIPTTTGDGYNAQLQALSDRARKDTDAMFKCVRMGNERRSSCSDPAYMACMQAANAAVDSCQAPYQQDWQAAMQSINNLNAKHNGQAPPK